MFACYSGGLLIFPGQASDMGAGVWNVYPMSTLGERIKSARGSLSQEAFSRALNISKGSLGFYERNENLPNTDVVLKICSKTGVSLEWLLTGAGSMRPDGEEQETLSREAFPQALCPRCVRLEERLERLEDERRELSMENRRLWKENAALRERCARFEEREKQESSPFFSETQVACTGERSKNG